MEPSVFDDISFFRTLDRSGTRALLIGRRALVLLGLPVLTAGYDFWIAIDDILTKQVATRPKDLEDIRLLRILKENNALVRASSAAWRPRSCGPSCSERSVPRRDTRCCR